MLSGRTLKADIRQDVKFNGSKPELFAKTKIIFKHYRYTKVICHIFICTKYICYLFEQIKNNTVNIPGPSYLHVLSKRAANVESLKHYQFLGTKSKKQKITFMT